MKLAFIFHPVTNLKASLAYYRDTLGFEEAWREGELTAALKLPNSDVQLMLEEDEQNLPPSGVYLVESVDDFYSEKKELLSFIMEPKDIAPGRYAIFKDIDGHLYRVIDFTNEQ